MVAAGRHAPGVRSSATLAHRSAADGGPTKLARTTPSPSATSTQGTGVDAVALVAGRGRPGSSTSSTATASLSSSATFSHVPRHERHVVELNSDDEPVGARAGEVGAVELVGHGAPGAESAPAARLRRWTTAATTDGDDDEPAASRTRSTRKSARVGAARRFSGCCAGRVRCGRPAGDAGGARVGIAPAEHCPEVEVDDTTAAIRDAVGWFEANQRPNGQWAYLVSRDGEDLGGYNIVRHAGVMLSLYQAANAGVDGRRCHRVAERGLDFVDDNLDTSTRTASPSSTRNARPAPGGRAARGCALERREATGDTDRDDLLVDLGTFLLGQVEPSGAVRSAYGVPDEYSKYATGQALWGFIQLDARVPRTRASARPPIPHPRLPARPGRRGGPLPADGRPLGRLRATASSATERARRRSQRAHAGTSPGSSACRCASSRRSGTAGSPAGARQRPGQRLRRRDPRRGWRRAAPPVGDDDVPGLTERVRCVAGMLVERQVDDDRDPAVDGAWFTDGVTRMDDQQHAISALLGVRAVAATSGDIAVGGGEDAHGRLWVLVAALGGGEPGARARGTDRRITTLAVARRRRVVAAVSGPVLDAHRRSARRAPHGRRRSRRASPRSRPASAAGPDGDDGSSSARVAGRLSVGADDGVLPVAAGAAPRAGTALRPRQPVAATAPGRPLAIVRSPPAWTCCSDGIFAV